MFLFSLEKSIGLLPEAYLSFDPLVDDATLLKKNINNVNNKIQCN
jgi:hypothetical protein